MQTIDQTIQFLKENNIQVDESKCGIDGEKLNLAVLNDVPFSVLDKLTDHYCRVTLGHGVLILTNVKD